MKKTKKSRTKTLRRKTYSNQDYKSNDGMLTTVWGPSMWHFLHTMSFNYPDQPTCEEKRNYRDFVLSLRNVLPCGKCRRNFCKNLAKLPMTLARLESRATFSKYMYELHELVNTMLHKESGLSFAEVRERYEHFRSRCTTAEAPMPTTTKEDGCTEPLYGEKSKCVLHIMPQSEKCETFQMDKKCVKKR